MPNVNCKICTNEFYAKPNHLNKGWGKYCSKKCQTEGQKIGKFVLCEICSNEIWKMPKEIKHSKSQKFFCSKSCQAIWRNKTYSGENHARWTTGINAYRKILRRQKIQEICTKCGYDNKLVLIVHHIDHNRNNNEIKNLMWLCRNCHYLIHNRKTF
jgi:hypothetical protein